MKTLCKFIQLSAAYLNLTISDYNKCIAQHKEWKIECINLFLPNIPKATKKAVIVVHDLNGMNAIC